MSIGFIGGGNMAFALVSGLVEAGLVSETILVSDLKPSAKDRFCALSSQVQFTNDNADVLSRCRLVVLAVKPQQITDVLRSGAEVLQRQSQDLSICSVAAGISCSTIKDYLPETISVVRAMPNTPALIRSGVTGLYSPDASAQTRHEIEKLFSAVGSVLWVKDEKHMQAITATSGSGPAYFFAFMEMMVEGAKALGLSQQQAQQLVIQTALGASQLAAKEGATNLAALREQVTSPGGTTEAGLKVFRSRAHEEHVAATLKAAYQRSIELEQG